MFKPGASFATQLAVNSTTVVYYRCKSTHKKVHTVYTNRLYGSIIAFCRFCAKWIELCVTLIFLLCENSATNMSKILHIVFLAF